VPVYTDADGVIRVAGTRATLDTIVGAFDAGATPEEIAQQYSSVPLKDIYAGGRGSRAARSAGFPGGESTSITHFRPRTAWARSGRSSARFLR
jgi:hypothetical protein